MQLTSRPTKRKSQNPQKVSADLGSRSGRWDLMNFFSKRLPRAPRTELEGIKNILISITAGQRNASGLCVDMGLIDEIEKKASCRSCTGNNSVVNTFKSSAVQIVSTSDELRRSNRSTGSNSLRTSLVAETGQCSTVNGLTGQSRTDEKGAIMSSKLRLSGRAAIRDHPRAEGRDGASGRVELVNSTSHGPRERAWRIGAQS